jgi:hypothetical protein
MDRLRHDVAWATTKRILELFNLRDEEKCEAFPMVYERVKDGLLVYDTQTKDILRRLRPLSN